MQYNALIYNSYLVIIKNMIESKRFEHSNEILHHFFSAVENFDNDFSGDILKIEFLDIDSPVYSHNFNTLFDDLRLDFVEGDKVKMLADILQIGLDINAYIRYLTC